MNTKTIITALLALVALGLTPDGAINNDFHKIIARKV